MLKLCSSNSKWKNSLVTIIEFRTMEKARFWHERKETHLVKFTSDIDAFLQGRTIRTSKLAYYYKYGGENAVEQYYQPCYGAKFLPHRHIHVI